MKNWIWGSMFVVYLVIGTGLLVKAFYHYWQDWMKSRHFGQERAR